MNSEGVHLSILWAFNAGYWCGVRRMRMATARAEANMELRAEWVQLARIANRQVVLNLTISRSLAKGIQLCAA